MGRYSIYYNNQAYKLKAKINHRNRKTIQSGVQTVMIRALLTRDRGNLEIKNNRCTNIRFFFF